MKTILHQQRMTELRKIFSEHQGNIIHKWDHYFEIYDRHFARFKHQQPVILEIGVAKGGSMEMWRKYFGEGCKIIGIDINPACRQFENDHTKIYIGSQGDRNFLQSIKKEIPKVDILIDDGSHMMEHLKISFQELYDWVDENGVYLAEDLHTCYWHEYEGGYKRHGSFIEFCKQQIDQLNAWFSRQRKLKVNRFSRTTHSIHFYNSIVVFEKRKIEDPFDVLSGKIDASDVIHRPPALNGVWRKFKNKIYKHTGIDL